MTGRRKNHSLFHSSSLSFFSFFLVSLDHGTTSNRPSTSTTATNSTVATPRATWAACGASAGRTTWGEFLLKFFSRFFPSSTRRGSRERSSSKLKKKSLSLSLSPPQSQQRQLDRAPHLRQDPLHELQRLQAQVRHQGVRAARREGSGGRDEEEGRGCRRWRCLRVSLSLVLSPLIEFVFFFFLLFALRKEERGREFVESVSRENGIYQNLEKETTQFEVERDFVELNSECGALARRRSPGSLFPLLLFFLVIVVDRVSLRHGDEVIAAHQSAHLLVVQGRPRSGSAVIVKVGRRGRRAR